MAQNFQSKKTFTVEPLTRVNSFEGGQLIGLKENIAFSSGGSGAAESLVSLSDTYITALVDGQFLQYEESSLKWKNVSLNTAQWDAAYNDKINSIVVSGAGNSKTITLNQQDGGSLFANIEFTDTNSFVTTATFNTSTGQLSLGRNDGLGDVNVDLDGRYITAETDTLDSVANRGASTAIPLTLSGTLNTAQILSSANIRSNNFQVGTLANHYGFTRNAISGDLELKLQDGTVLVTINSSGDILATGGVGAYSTVSGGGGTPTLNLGDLLDVTIASPSDGQAILYNAISGKWENSNVSGLDDIATEAWVSSNFVSNTGGVFSGLTRVKTSDTSNTSIFGVAGSTAGVRIGEVGGKATIDAVDDTLSASYKIMRLQASSFEFEGSTAINGALTSNILRVDGFTYGNSTTRFDQNSASYFRLFSSAGMQFFNTSSVLQGYVFHDSTGFGLLYQSGAWAVRTSGSTVNVHNQLRIEASTAGGLILRSAYPTGGSYIQFCNNAETDRGYIGYGSGANDDFYIYNQTFGSLRLYGNSIDLYNNTSIAGSLATISITTTAYSVPAPRFDNSFYVLQSQHWYGHTGSETLYLGESGNHIWSRGSMQVDGSHEVNGIIYADAGEAIRLRGTSGYISFYTTGGTRDGYLQGAGSQMYLVSDSGRLNMRANNHTMLLETNGYLYTPTWINIGSGAGIFSSTNGAHFYPSTAGSYGTWQLDGSRNSYTGIRMSFGGSTTIGMFDGGGNGGTYDESIARWHFYWHKGNTCLGIGGSSTTSGYSADVNGSLYVRGSIVATGNVSAYSTSDIRFKNIIGSISSPLERLSRLGGYEFTWNKDIHSASKGQRDIGVVAQEVEKEFPELVRTNPEGVKQVEYAKLTAILIEAVKELSEKVTRLEHDSSS